MEMYPIHAKKGVLFLNKHVIKVSSLFFIINNHFKTHKTKKGKGKRGEIILIVVDPDCITPY
jgi:hypothetical protein